MFQFRTHACRSCSALIVQNCTIHVLSLSILFSLQYLRHCQSGEKCVLANPCSMLMCPCCAVPQPSVVEPYCCLCGRYYMYRTLLKKPVFNSAVGMICGCSLDAYLIMLGKQLGLQGNTSMNLSDTADLCLRVCIPKTLPIWNGRIYLYSRVVQFSVIVVGSSSSSSFTSFFPLLPFLSFPLCLIFAFFVNVIIFGRRWDSWRRYGVTAIHCCQLHIFTLL